MTRRPQTSILDDFCFCDERERVLQERKARHLTSSAKNAGASINQLSDNLAETLELEDDKQVLRSE